MSGRYSAAASSRWTTETTMMMTVLVALRPPSSVLYPPSALPGSSSFPMLWPLNPFGTRLHPPPFFHSQSSRQNGHLTVIATWIGRLLKSDVRCQVGKLRKGTKYSKRRPIDRQNGQTRRQVTLLNHLRVDSNPKILESQNPSDAHPISCHSGVPWRARVFGIGSGFVLFAILALWSNLSRAFA